MPHLPLGTIVKITSPIKEDGVIYDTGELIARDGEYHTVNLFYDGRYSKQYPDGIPVERYGNELTPVTVERDKRF